jgi:hypothetical protein
VGLDGFLGVPGCCRSGCFEGLHRVSGPPAMAVVIRLSLSFARGWRLPEFQPLLDNRPLAMNLTWSQSGGFRMRKTYEKPILVKRERLSAVTADCTPSTCVPQ